MSTKRFRVGDIVRLGDDYFNTHYHGERVCVVQNVGGATSDVFYYRSPVGDGTWQVGRNADYEMVWPSEEEYVDR